MTTERRRADTRVPTWPARFAERYRAAGYWRGETFGAMLRERARAHGERIAVVAGDERWSYADLDARVDRLARGFETRGIGPGDRVVVQLPNIPEFFEVVFALFRLGALPVFALPAHRHNEIAYFCGLTDAAAYVIPGTVEGFDYRELAGEVIRSVPDLREVIVVAGGDEDAGGFTTVEELRVAATDATEQRREGGGPAPSDIAFLQLSGGSTGLPKLIPRTHDDYLYSVRASAEICGLDEHDVYLGVLPIAHNFPLSSPGVLGALYAGARVVPGRPDPDVAFALIESERVTITGVVPPLALSWLNAAEITDHDLSSLRVLQVGGARFGVEAARRVRPTLGCTLQQVFGMAEGLVNYTRLDGPEEVIVTTQGRPISPDDEIRIVDDADRDVPTGEPGHLLTRGPYTIRGYYRAVEHNAKAFTAEGFYRTGDIVRMTGDGDLIVEGRAKEQINRGGEKIAAEEVENHILAHPAVHDVAVVAVPDEFLGERTCAYVIPRGTPPRKAELRRFVRDRGLAAYKIPDRVEIVDEFPYTGVGKISKREIRRAIEESIADTARPT